jgi:hypothetical protein
VARYELDVSIPLRAVNVQTGSWGREPAVTYVSDHSLPSNEEIQNAYATHRPEDGDHTHEQLYNTRKLPVNNDAKIERRAPNTFLLKSITKQHIKIKIITYLCLITKAGKRKHVNICFAALYRSTCT